MAWGYLIFAGLFGALGLAAGKKLHKGHSLKSMVLFIIGLGTSFIFLKFAMETLSMVTAYIIWIGISITVEELVVKRLKSWTKFTFITIILGSSIGLVFVS